VNRRQFILGLLATTAAARVPAIPKLEPLSGVLQWSSDGVTWNESLTGWQDYAFDNPALVREVTLRVYHQRVFFDMLERIDRGEVTQLAIEFR
jgi:hypothetical protein